MKLHTSSLFLIAALSVPFVAGCSEETSNAASKTAASATKDMKQMGAKAVDAAQNLPSHFDEQLASLDATLADLKQKAEAKGGEAKVQFDALMVRIKAKKDEVTKALSEMDLTGASADKLAAAKSKVDEKMKELSKLVDQAKDK